MNNNIALGSEKFVLVCLKQMFVNEHVRTYAGYIAKCNNGSPFKVTKKRVAAVRLSHECNASGRAYGE